MRVGVAVPCHVGDEHLLPACTSHINQLKPPPYVTIVYVNDSGIRKARTRLYNHLFGYHHCDAVLQCSVDFQLFPDILRYVSSEKVVSFAGLSKDLADIPRVIARFIVAEPWTGCYSLPCHVWNRIKEDDGWDGSDGSVKQLVNDYRFVYRPMFYWLRRSPRRLEEAYRTTGLHKLKRLVVALL